MINKKLYSVNINSLNILDVLLREKNISETGRKLNLSQSAVSVALKNLRETFDDELLLKGSSKNQMEPTSFALSLREPLRKVIEDLDNIIFNNELQQLSSSRTLKLALTDAALMMFFPKLERELTKLYPKIKFDIIGFSEDKYIKQLNEGDIDVAVGVIATKNKPNSVYYQFLTKDKMVCIAKKGHPVLKNKSVSLKEYQKYNRVFLKFAKSLHDITKEIESQNSNDGHNKVLTIHSTMAAISTLLENEKVGIISYLHYLNISEYFDIDYVEPEFIKSDIDYSICCNHRYSNDPIIKSAFEIISKIVDDNIVIENC